MHPPRTRDRIVTAAQRLFGERGYANVSMPAIAEASGITAGAIYKHFESKEDLFFEAVAQRAIEAQLVATAGETGATADTLRLVAAYTTERMRLLRQLAVEVHAASVHNTKVRRLLSHALDGNIAQIRERIMAGQKRGELDRSIDADLTARAVMVFVMGLMHMETLLPSQIGDPKWHDFVADRIGVLIGAK
jgi:AcrR family transcriptional regulator